METLINCAMDIGEQMLTCGAEVHRAEESIKRMCLAFGAKRADVFIITTSMVVTVFWDEEKTYTQTRRIISLSTDFEKLHHLNQLSRKICAKKMTVEQIQEELNAAINPKEYPGWLEFLSYAVIAGAFTLFFGGTWMEMLCSFVIGAAVRACCMIVERAIPNRIFCKFVSATLATYFAFLAVRFGWVANVDKVIIGNIMSLIPGIGLTNALRDLFTGDSIAGILRCIEAVLTAMAIAAGYFLVVVLGGLMV